MMVTPQVEKIPIYRTEDHELMGYIRGQDESWQPLTIFDYPLKDYMAKHKAVEYLQLYGLEVLVDAWQFFDKAEDDWYNCEIVEAKPDRVTMRISDYGHPRVYSLITITEPTEHNVRRG